MEDAIDKLRAMQLWFDLQTEYFNNQFKTLKQLEKVFDFSREKGFEFMDDDYLFSDNVTEKERKEAFKFIKKVLQD